MSQYPCPYCGVRTDCTVIDSRANRRGRRSRRECTECNQRFTTQETTLGPDARYADRVTAPLRRAILATLNATLNGETLH